MGIPQDLPSFPRVILRGVFLEGNSYALLADQYWPMALIALVRLTAAGCLSRRRMY